MSECFVTRYSPEYELSPGEVKRLTWKLDTGFILEGVEMSKSITLFSLNIGDKPVNALPQVASVGQVINLEVANLTSEPCAARVEITGRRIT